MAGARVVAIEDRGAEPGRDADGLHGASPRACRPSALPTNTSSPSTAGDDCVAPPGSARRCSDRARFVEQVDVPVGRGGERRARRSRPATTSTGPRVSAWKRTRARGEVERRGRGRRGSRRPRRPDATQADEYTAWPSARSQRARAVRGAQGDDACRRSRPRTTRSPSTAGVARTLAPIRCDQRGAPVARSNACTDPSSVPTSTRVAGQRGGREHGRELARPSRAAVFVEGRRARPAPWPRPCRRPRGRRRPAATSAPCEPIFAR